MNENNTTTQQNPVTFILWLAFIQTHIMFVALTYLKIMPPSTSGYDNTLVSALTGVGVFCSLAAFFIFKKGSDGSRKAPDQRDPQNFVFYVLSWAANEAASIIGLVLPTLFTTQALPYSYALFAVGLGMHILFLRPAQRK